MNGQFERQQFTLHKMKVLGGGEGMEVSYSVKFDSELPSAEMTYKSTQPPIERVLVLLADFKQIVLKEWDLLELEERAEKATKGEKGIAESILNMIAQKRDDINISGITVRGDGQKRSMTIAYKLRGIGGMVAGHTTSRVFIGSEEDPRDSFGFEEDLRQRAEELETRCYAYVVEHEQAQLDLFSNPASNGDTAEDYEDDQD